MSVSGFLGGWAPALILWAGALATVGGVREQARVKLSAPLAEVIPSAIEGMPAQDITISAEEQSVAGMDDYVMRIYAPEGQVASTYAFSLYVGYYEWQSQGHAIHSPRNCLPGGGWEPLKSSREMVSTSVGNVPVNRYLIGNGSARALVLYWYQGRGRVEANEYRVKWNLLRDQTLRGRSDEALVRIIVPVRGTETDAFEYAVRVASRMIPTIHNILPAV